MPTQLARQRDTVSDIRFGVPHLWVVLDVLWGGSIFSLESHDLVNQKVSVLPARFGKLVKGKAVEHISKPLSCHTKIHNMEPVQEIALAGPYNHRGRRVLISLKWGSSPKSNQVQSVLLAQHKWQWVEVPKQANSNLGLRRSTF